MLSLVPAAAPDPVSEALPVPGYRWRPSSWMSAKIRPGSLSKPAAHPLGSGLVWGSQAVAVQTRLQSARLQIQQSIQLRATTAERLHEDYGIDLAAVAWPDE